MIKVGPYETFSHNYSARQSSSLTIKLDGAIMAKMRFKEPICDPLRMIQMHPASPHRAELVAQLRAAGTPEADIVELLKVAPSKYMRDKMKKEGK